MTQRKPSDLELMRLHVETLYKHDGRSRIESTNDWLASSAPRFFLGRTAMGNLWRFRADLSDELCEKLNRLCRAEPINISGPPRFSEDYEQLLSEHGPIEQVWHGPAYWFSGEIAAQAGSTVINKESVHLLRNGLEEWRAGLPCQQPALAIIEDGRALSICASVRISDMAHEAGIESLATHRRQGHGLAVLRAWVHAVRELEALPLYSTSFENVASLHVAAQLNSTNPPVLSLYGVDFSIT